MHSIIKVDPLNRTNFEFLISSAKLFEEINKFLFDLKLDFNTG